METIAKQEVPLILEINTKYLLSLVNPLETDVWGRGHISLDMIRKSEKNDQYWNADDDDQIWTADQHAGRILYLAENPTFDPISVDFGIPGMIDATITDGHHRLCAAVYRKIGYLPCSISGDVSCAYSHTVS